jgi:hypothetical protein
MTKTYNMKYFPYVKLIKLLETLYKHAHKVSRCAADAVFIINDAVLLPDHIRQFVTCAKSRRNHEVIIKKTHQGLCSAQVRSQCILG